jgi:hypothetical protein
MSQGGSAKLKLEPGNYTVEWYNPRTGGALQRGSIQKLQGGAETEIGAPPADPAADWAVLIRRAR